VVHGDVGAAPTAAPGLGRHDLVVHRAEPHSVTGPGVDEVGERDGPAGSRRVANRQVLPEGLGALDGGLVDLLVLDDGVRAAVAGHGAHDLTGAVRRATPVFDHVVLDQRVGRPAVERDQGGAAAVLEAAGVLDRAAGAARVPADTGDEVADVVPPDGIVLEYLFW
jgi:hypothetical protein